MQDAVAEDEFDLLRVRDTMVRWKYLLGLGLLVGLAAGMAAGLLVRPLYQSRAVFHIGRVGQLGSIQNAAELVQQLRQAHGLDEGTPRGGAAPHVTSVEEIAQGMIVITARARTPEQSRAFLHAELQAILRDHEALFEEATRGKTRAREILIARIAQIETQAGELARRAEAIAPRDPALGAILTQDQVRLTTELSQLDQRLIALDLELAAVATRPTRVLREPTLPGRPVGRSRLFLALAGAAAGVFMAVAAAFVLEMSVGRQAHRG